PGWRPRAGLAGERLRRPLLRLLLHLARPPPRPARRNSACRRRGGRRRRQHRHHLLGPREARGQRPDVHRDRQGPLAARTRLPQSPHVRPLAAGAAGGHARSRGDGEGGSGMTLADIAATDLKASEFVLIDEVGEDEAAAASLLATMRSRIVEMRDAIDRGLASREPSRTGMVGWNANQLDSAPDVLGSPLLKRVQAYAMAVNEENSRMGRIVAAPTAGSAGTVPGALLGVADHLGRSDDELVMLLVLAAGVAEVIGKHMFIAGSTGGCQAEIGSSAAMADRKSGVKGMTVDVG